jgi:hypothetical protein
MALYEIGLVTISRGRGFLSLTREWVDPIRKYQVTADVIQPIMSSNPYRCRFQRRLDSPRTHLCIGAALAPTTFPVRQMPCTRHPKMTQVGMSGLSRRGSTSANKGAASYNLLAHMSTSRKSASQTAWSSLWSHRESFPVQYPIWLDSTVGLTGAPEHQECAKGDESH